MLTREEMCLALMEARPGEEWHLDDTGIRWLTPGKTVPTSDEIAAAWDRVKNRRPDPVEPSAMLRDVAMMAEELAKAKAEIAKINSDMQAFVQAAVAAAVGAKS